MKKKISSLDEAKVYIENLCDLAMSSTENQKDSDTILQYSELIVQQSIQKNWKDLYPLSEKFKAENMPKKPIYYAPPKGSIAEKQMKEYWAQMKAN